MASFLTQIVVASFFCAIINALASEKGSGKTVKTVTSLVMLCLVIFPMVKSIISFYDKFDIPVINDRDEHINYSREDDTLLYREWLAKTTANELSETIKVSVKEGTGLSVRVECPWHFEGENVVFDKIKVYTSASKSYYESITNYVKLHFSLDCECYKEVE